MGRDDAPNRIERDVAEASEDYRKLGRREGEGTQGAQSAACPSKRAVRRNPAVRRLNSCQDLHSGSGQSCT